MLLELLSYSFFQNAIISAVIMGIVCPLIGVFVILKGISFIGAGTAHAAFAGVTLAYLIGFNPAAGAFMFSLATVLLIGTLDIKGSMRSEVYIGIFYTITMALAVLFLGMMKEYNAEVYGYLFGSILTITNAELKTIIILGGIVVGVIILLFKELHFISTDYEMAEASGIPARSIYFILLALIATTIMVGLKSVGSLLVFAMMLIPAASAYQLAKSMKSLIKLSVSAGLFSSIGGLLLSYFFNLPSGATIILVNGTIFFICALVPKENG